MESKVLQKKLLEHFEWLHRHPELSNAEFNTTAYIRAALNDLGVEILDTGLKTGLVAIVCGTAANYGAKTVALRADIDALPLSENTDLSYKSENAGCMHACGHDFHTAALIGAAAILSERKNDLRGNVKLIFQPAEEVTGGALAVLETGALDDVAAIFGMHVWPAYKNGVVTISEGATFASAIAFKIEIHGKGGHASAPHQCIDPIIAAAQLINAGQTIVSRSTDPSDRVVVSVTQIEAGSTWNIIPSSAFLQGTIRAIGTKKAEKAARTFAQICKGVEAATGAIVNYTYHLDTPSTNNDPALCVHAVSAAQNAGFTVEPFISTMAGEDFAVYQEKIPGVFAGFSVITPQGLHHPSFCVDTSDLSRGAALLATLAEDALQR